MSLIVYYYSCCSAILSPRVLTSSKFLNQFKFFRLVHFYQLSEIAFFLFWGDVQM